MEKKLTSNLTDRICLGKYRHKYNTFLRNKSRKQQKKFKRIDLV